MGLSIELIDIKKYLRVAHDEDDALISGLVDVAKQSIKEQTGVVYSEADETYKNTIMLAVHHYYYNRASVMDKSTSSLPYSLDDFITLIKHRGALGNV